MLKRIFLLAFIGMISLAARAQSADSVYSEYLDFNLARLQGEQDKVLELGEDLLPKADKLPEKARISFYFSIGKMYEDNNQPGKALPFYEKVAAAAPDYYVVHRALGYLYLGMAEEARKKMGTATNNANNPLIVAYTNAVRRSLPHLEKAQACDPSDETLTVIKLLYKNIQDTKALESLPARLKELGKNCVDILSN